LQTAQVLSQFEKVAITYVPREQNIEADHLANEAMKRKP